MDDEDTGRPVAEYFGVDGDGPKVTLLENLLLVFLCMSLLCVEY